MASLWHTDVFRAYRALVESIRTSEGSRHRTVAYLGALGKAEQSGWAQLGSRLSRKERPRPSLFDPPRYDEPTDDEPVLVKLSGVELQRIRDFGAAWLGLGLWRLLGLDRLLADLMPAGKEERMEAGLEKLKTGIDSGRPKDLGIAHERLRRLWERCRCASGAFDVQIKQDERKSGKASLSITWSRNGRWSDWTSISEGCYLLRANLARSNPATWWKQYIQLTPNASVGSIKSLKCSHEFCQKSALGYLKGRFVPVTGQLGLRVLPRRTHLRGCIRGLETTNLL